MKAETLFPIFVLLARILTINSFSQQKISQTSSTARGSSSIDPLEEMKTTSLLKDKQLSSRFLEKQDRRMGQRNRTVEFESTPSQTDLLQTNMTMQSVVNSNSENIFWDNKTSVFYSLRNKTGIVQIEINNQTVPLIMLSEFNFICKQLIPRISLTSFLINVLITLPSLPLIKYKLGYSILPFLLTGPITFIIPYLYYFLWDINILNESSIINDYLNNYIYKKRDYAYQFIEERQSKGPPFTANYILLKRFYDMNPVELYDNIISLRNSYGRGKRN